MTIDYNEPLKRIINPDNIADKVERANDTMLPGANLTGKNTDEIFENTGNLIVDRLIAPSPDVETSEITSTDFIGTFISGEGEIFGSQIVNIGGVNLGILQWGANQSDGTLTAGGGVVRLDENGIEIMVAATPQDLNSYKLLDSSGVTIGRLSGYDNTEVSPSVILAAINVPLEIDAGTSSVTIRGSNNIYIDDNLLIRSKVIAPKKINLTIASDAITVTGMYHRIDTEGGAASDNLATINGGEDGQLLILATVNSARDVTLVETGNIRVGSGTTRVLNNINDRIMLQNDGTNWVEVSFADND